MIVGILHVLYSDLKGTAICYMREGGAFGSFPHGAGNDRPEAAISNGRV